jgi:ribulose-5-phosphate 4-epimerase/fuculose-1-phosphate aldolase
MTSDLAHLRRTVALGCRVLAASGATTALLGHVSVRLEDGRVLVRCRGPRERGLLFTEASDIRVVGLDDSGDVGEGYRLPNEFPIHAEILRARPGVGSVVHAHPRSVVVADLAGLALRPVFGAFDIPAYRLAADGLAGYPHSGLVRTAASGRALAAALGDRPACVLRGHGVVTVGDGPIAAVLRVLALDELARVTLQVARAGGQPDEVPEADRADLPDLGAEFNERALWRHHVGRLALRGLDEVGAGD